MYIVLMTKEGCTKIVTKTFITPGAGVLMFRHGHISHQRIMMLLSYTIVDFHSFYDGAVDIQI